MERYNQAALLVSSTDGVAALPLRLLARYAAQLDLFDLPFEFPDFTLSMAWHPRAHQVRRISGSARFLDAVE